MSASDKIHGVGHLAAPDYSTDTTAHTLWEVVRYLELNPEHGRAVDADNGVVTIGDAVGGAILCLDGDGEGRYGVRLPVTLRAIPPQVEVEPRSGAGEVER